MKAREVTHSITQVLEVVQGKLMKMVKVCWELLRIELVASKGFLWRSLRLFLRWWRTACRDLGTAVFGVELGKEICHGVLLRFPTARKEDVNDCWVTGNVSRQYAGKMLRQKKIT